MTTKVRNSNFELLRIIAMLFIVIWHISIHAQRGELATHNIAIAFTTTGVNLFVLISGFFRIKLKWKSLITILGTVIFFYTITLFLGTFLRDKQPTSRELMRFIGIISLNHWWFIRCYIELMLLSPLINLFLNKCNEKQYLYTLSILILMASVSGFIFGNPLNDNGRTTFQFLTIYILGDSIRRFNLMDIMATKTLILTYAIATAGIFLCTQITEKAYFYNNPFIIIASVSLFCLISKKSFYNKRINTIAKYMLPVYLLQESTIGAGTYSLLYKFGSTVNFDGMRYYGILILYVILLFVGAVIMENTRRFIMNKPIDTISKYLDKKLDFFSF